MVIFHFLHIFEPLFRPGLLADIKTKAYKTIVQKEMSGFLSKLIKNPIVLNLLLAVVITIAAIMGTLSWLDTYTRHNEAVVVPDVKGLTIEKAEEFFKSNNLRYNIVDSVYSKDVAPGAIVEILPSAGSKVKEGRIVFITVNATTSQMAALPEVEDLSFRQAYALLKASGFNRVEIVYKPGEYKDLAIGVESNGILLSAGKLIPLTAPLDLLVSSGEKELPEEMNDSIPEGEPLQDADVETWF